jgi:hypothetical protein
MVWELILFEFVFGTALIFFKKKRDGKLNKPPCLRLLPPEAFVMRKFAICIVCLISTTFLLFPVAKTFADADELAANKAGYSGYYQKCYSGYYGGAGQ